MSSNVGNERVWVNSKFVVLTAVLMKIQFFLKLAPGWLVKKNLPAFGRRLFRSATSALRLHKP